ncbi:dynamin, putative [Talaromyces stipitatus ATCC 10500]|uniref:Dynamin, putative n=1 Tax=Talaromyces stipitatus (strain ATCC 10500 / CBS 375.48 / QM 6759 / NRRL 1006) TaxID=441959 RepID=B8LU54_TALSN|nr:dynamin, putative [Talaromyces stipitatus ATCC 10500]EED22526.1 dynamin, putative [Talaromyces stipitatus ATCC 10500]
MSIQTSDDHESLADPALLDKIDKLFACNVGEYINLPQLVVVGDQSSGKSSVLEGLTKLAFPRDSGLCTRFATQIIFRRIEAGERTITDTIIPGSDANNPSQLREWKASDLQSLDGAAFSAVMSEVHALMGLSTSKEDGKPTFSSNVLRLEICGPDEDHLSVIDVPGIFRNTTPGVTTKGDKDMVREMVLEYMRNPRSIMLTVVPANVDIATQEIIDMEREVDPEGKRTLGVLTKPDLIDRGAESRVVDLVEDREMRLKLGWIIVRNLGQMELQEGITDRDAAEERFRLTPPWNTLSKDRFGIKALKSRLQETVTVNARETFPEVRGEISKKLRDCQNELQALGVERETREQQLGYLLGIMNLFQDITRQALTTSYSSNDSFDSQWELRLATRIVNRNDVFSKDMAVWGHKYEFARDADGDSNSSDSEVKHEDEDVESARAVARVEHLKIRKTSDMPDLEVLVHSMETDRVVTPRSHIHSWIEKQYRDSRGFEIGTFSSTLLATTMKQQSDKWTSIARAYIRYHLCPVTMSHRACHHGILDCPCVWFRYCHHPIISNLVIVH